MKRTLSIAAIAAAAFLLLSCASPREQYVKADRLTYESIAPWVREKADITNKIDKAKVDDLEAWDLRLRAAEGEFNR